jgi:hypothetical protein
MGFEFVRDSLNLNPGLPKNSEGSAPPQTLRPGPGSHPGPARKPTTREMEKPAQGGLFLFLYLISIEYQIRIINLPNIICGFGV